MPPSIYAPFLLVGALAQLPTAIYAMTHPQRQKGQALTDRAKSCLALSLVGALAILVGTALVLVGP
ncbi:hypothetical protein N2K95_14830 [Arthrobacter zhaoxinii]|uniref:Uncharacterized protein n=1 Tax=Arthrobacter zhaoxinii TaxID=2964616 RepID=A0ABY5YS82_9MICC|nr:hypothetical protein [Arthrobacter zhaoxinii]UWX96889.1 hypothetical protein N2K95_14830 [Arthrobacter zhaoxinii]